MVSRELDIVKQCIEMIEHETRGLYSGEGSLNANSLQELLHGDEAPLEEALDRLLRATLAENVSLINEKGSPPMLTNELQPEGKLLEADAVWKYGAPKTQLCDDNDGLVCDDTDVGRPPAPMLSSAEKAPGSFGAGVSAVDILKRKLSMLTAGIRLLHTQIEEKSIELLGSPSNDFRCSSTSEEKGAELFSPIVGDRSLIHGKIPKRGANLASQRQAQSRERATPPPDLPRRPLTQRGGSVGRRSLGQRAPAPGHAQSPRGSFGRRGARDSPRETTTTTKVVSKADKRADRSPNESDIRLSSRPMQDPPRPSSKPRTPGGDRGSLGSRARPAVARQESGVNKATALSPRSVQTARDSGEQNKPLRTPRGTAPPSPPRDRSPRSHAQYPSGANGSPRLMGGNSRHGSRACSPSQRPRAPTPPSPIFDRFSDLGEKALPIHWCSLLSEAYREVTGRPLVDRIRLLECSSASGRRSDTHVFWLHTMVRWGDMRLYGSERVPERGEDLTLFVLHSHRQVDSGIAHDRTEERHLRYRPQYEPVWHVASVRVLNSLSSVEEPGDGEHWEMMGRLGTILLNDALGPVLDSRSNNSPSMPATQGASYEEESRNTAIFPSRSDFDFSSETVAAPSPQCGSPACGSPACGSPAAPPPTCIAVPKWLSNGSLSVPVPHGSLRAQPTGTSSIDVPRGSLTPTWAFPNLPTSLQLPTRRSLPSTPHVPGLLFGAQLGCQPPAAAQVMMPLSARCSPGSPRGPVGRV